jgi:3-hydroxybutyryl-CoA dehydrogenase
MGHATTAKETMAAAEAFVRSIKLVPVITKREVMGFAFNRIWRAIKKEALHVVAAGYADFEDIDRAWMLSFSVPRGPFGRMDEIGLDVIHHIEIQYYLDSGDESDKPPKFLEKFLAEGRLGVKSGKGFYTYPNPEYEGPGWLRKEAPWRPEQTIKLD